MQRVRKHFHIYLLNICTNKFVARKTLWQSLIIWKWKTQYFTISSMFSTLYVQGERGQVLRLILVSLEANFLVHWSYSHISNGFLTNRQYIAKKTQFSSEGSLRRYINRPDHVTQQNILHLLKLEELSFENSLERKLWNQRPYYYQWRHNPLGTEAWA